MEHGKQNRRCQSQSVFALRAKLGTSGSRCIRFAMSMANEAARQNTDVLHGQPAYRAVPAESQVYCSGTAAAAAAATALRHRQHRLQWRRVAVAAIDRSGGVLGLCLHSSNCSSAGAHARVPELRMRR
jgi:hypothetical protein